MKAIHLKCVTALAMSLSACACVPSVDEPAQPASPAPTPIATPAPAPTPTPTAVPVVNEPVFDNYLDAPQTSGTWEYINDRRGRMASFGANQNKPDFMIRCTGPRIALVRTLDSIPTSSRTMTLTTETATLGLTAEAIPQLPSANFGMVSASVEPNNPILDAMATTKGRIAIGLEGERTLYLPAWVEISRVIEDCR